MKRIIFLCVFAFLSIKSSAQSWDESADCHINAQDNAADYARTYRTPPREATVKIRFADGSECTGTPMNCRTGDDARCITIGQVFTSRKLRFGTLRKKAHSSF